MRTIEVLPDKDLIEQIEEGKCDNAKIVDFEELAKELGVYKETSSIHHRADPLVGEQFKQERMRLAAIDDMHLRDRALNRADTATDLRDHPALNRAIAYQVIHL